jgi:hypothetical protein
LIEKVKRGLERGAIRVRPQFDIISVEDTVNFGRENGGKVTNVEREEKGRETGSLGNPGRHGERGGGSSVYKHGLGTVEQERTDPGQEATVDTEKGTLVNQKVNRNSVKGTRKVNECDRNVVALVECRVPLGERVKEGTSTGSTRTEAMLRGGDKVVVREV